MPIAREKTYPFKKQESPAKVTGSGQVLSDSDWLYSTMNQRVTHSCNAKDLENDKVFRT